MNALAAFRPRGLTWVALRVHRSALLVCLGLTLGAAAGLIWLHGLGRQAAVENHSCEWPPRDGTPACEPLDAFSSPGHDFTHHMSLASTVIAWLPLAVALYAGGVLIGRELERGTAALAWAQSGTPARWLASKLLPAALLITTCMTLLSLLYRWPRSAGADALGSAWYADEVFRALGPSAQAHALLALAAGAFAGLVLRRALPAAGLALGITASAAFLAERYRELLWPAARRTVLGSYPGMPGSWWQLESAWVTGTGQLVTGPCRDATGAVIRCRPPGGIAGRYEVYHPASHFWPLQLVESGLVLATAALLTVAAFRMVRRRHG
ncbi:hypothetical protein ACFXOM_20905 [Streptomyces sp. NPDC059169]|uniref:hypothetical protein n=1 Tax=Streptomyces sp. NPDC059169 TaxID=3346754 RepID=UPI0036A26D2C